MSGPRLPLQGLIGLRRSGAMAADNPNQPGDVIAVVPPSTYALPSRVAKEQAEDLQIDSFAHALGLAVGERVPWERGSDQDAPDRTITVGGKRMEIELTALTAGKLRAERQRLSDVAELVRDAIADIADLRAALSGWTVDLSDAADRPMPTKSGAPTTAARITSLLATRSALSPPLDNGAEGAVRDELEGTRGISGPEVDSRHLIDGIQVRVIRHNTTDTRIVTHASQASITLSEARRILHDRLVDKNSKMRENVVVCSGDPDRDSVILPLDVAAFELLNLFGFGELPPVPKVKCAWLHLTGTTELIPLISVGKPELPDRSTEKLDRLPCVGFSSLYCKDRAYDSIRHGITTVANIGRGLPATNRLAEATVRRTESEAATSRGVAPGDQPPSVMRGDDGFATAPDRRPQSQITSSSLGRQVG